MTIAKKKIYKPSKKSKLVYKSFHKAKYTILEGAVRSSKSYTANLLAIKYIQTIPACDILISGYTISSVARNVVSEWKEIIDPNNRGVFKSHKTDKDDFMTINWRGLKNKKFYIRGGGTESDFKQIQGSTFGFWYADEATQHVESFINMAISRLSLDYSKAIWTLNPDTPYHFLKKRFIDDETLYELRENGTQLFQKFHYTLYDNASLSQLMIDEYEAQFTGMFYSRYVLGQWTLAEGIIYDGFNDEDHIYHGTELPTIRQWYVAVDYGTQNPCTFLLFGEAWDNVTRHKSYWLEAEYWYSGRDSREQKTDEQYCIDMEDWLEDIGDIKPGIIYVDPSAASFILALTNHGFPAQGADNNVDDGIRLQAEMLASGDYKINRMCVNTIKEYAMYSWDQKAAERSGKDTPLKINDHTKDAERYFFNTRIGFKPKFDFKKMMG